MRTFRDNDERKNAAVVSLGGAVIWFYRSFARISSNHMRQRISVSQSLKGFRRS